MAVPKVLTYIAFGLSETLTVAPIMIGPNDYNMGPYTMVQIIIVRLSPFHDFGFSNFDQLPPRLK